MISCYVTFAPAGYKEIALISKLRYWELLLRGIYVYTIHQSPTHLDLFARANCEPCYGVYNQFIICRAKTTNMCWAHDIMLCDLCIGYKEIA